MRAMRQLLMQTRALCARRRGTPPDLSLGAAVARFRRTVEAAQRRTGGVADALREALGESLYEQVWIEQVTAANVVVGVSSSALAYQVDRALREGGLVSMRAQLHTPTLRVRTRVGRPPE